MKPFDPKFMKVGVLTAALQELTPRDVRDPDPDKAIEEWLAYAKTLGASYIQLSAALHPTETDVPPEAMLDPVANTLDLRQPFTKERATRVRKAIDATGVGLSDVGYFDNLLHHDPAIRKKKIDFMLRTFDAAAALGVDAVCGFVGRNQERSMDQNLQDFEQHFVPLLKEAKARGLTYRVEQCPMPGWTTGDNWHNNIAYTPGTWIALHRIAEKHGVGDQFRIHYDPSHAILMGQDTRSIFQFLKDEGYNFLIGGFHVKGQVVDARGWSAWGSGGQTVERGDWKDRWPSPSTSCPARPATIRWPISRTAASTGSITSWRRASCSRSTWPTRTSSSSTSTRRRASRTRRCSRRSSRGRSPSSATSTKRPAPCSRCSTTCWRRRGSPSRASAGRLIGRSAVKP
jgi:sugar phosphate isomerase/epimerase